jgi:hypothetical protein
MANRQRSCWCGRPNSAELWSVELAGVLLRQRPMRMRVGTAAIVLWTAAACVSDPPPDARPSPELFGVIMMELQYPASWTGRSSPCFVAVLADVDPDTPGPQYECSIVMRTDVDTRVDECEASPSPRRCWRIIEDVAECSFHGLKLEIVHSEQPPERYAVLAQCVSR